jgi:hypothetical protein
MRKMMPGEEYTSLEALIERGDPSRLAIDIRLQTAPVGYYDPADLQRAIRDGFHEALRYVELERLIKASKPSKAKPMRWLGRTFAFALCAAIGSAATLILSASGPHSAPRYAVGSFAPPIGGQALSSLQPPDDAPSPDSQSTGIPPTPAAEAAAEVRRSPVGPGTFGLHEQ